MYYTKEEIRDSNEKIEKIAAVHSSASPGRTDVRIEPTMLVETPKEKSKVNW
jgi:hypothetical protein